MKILRAKTLDAAAAALVVGLICVSCKPTDQNPPPPATNAPPPAAPQPPPTNTAPKEPAAPVKITAQEAKDHIGESAIVEGKVFGVHVTAKGDVFINIGGAYPNQPFTAVCFQEAIPTDELKKLDGKTIKVTGKIKEHNGQPEIVLDDLKQILP